MACPEDRNLAQWGRNPQKYDQEHAVSPADYSVYQDAYPWSVPYLSSYLATVSAFDKNVPGKRVSAATHNTITTDATAEYGGRKLTDVAFPGSKAFMFEGYGRHATGPIDYRTFFGFETAKVMVQLFDTSVAIRPSKDAQPGQADPNKPLGKSRQVVYAAKGAMAYPTPPDGRPTGTYLRYMFTRSGLKGIDFGGNEIISIDY